MNRLGLLLIGAGGGTIAGILAGRPMMVPAVIAGVLGLILLVAGARRGTGDLVGDAAAARAEPAVSAESKPSLKGLGPQVDRILRLAEEQAADHLAEAEAKAARIVADAQAKAQRLTSD